MGTRSLIIAKLTSGETKAISCHWDGYPDHHGPILLDHYSDQLKIDELITLGDLSSLHENIGKKHDFHLSAEYQGCTAYGRDGGQENIDARLTEVTDDALRDLANAGAEFLYLWDGQRWMVTTPESSVGGLQPLREFMKGKKQITQTVKFGSGFVLGRVKTCAGA